MNDIFGIFGRLSLVLIFIAADKIWRTQSTHLGTVLWRLTFLQGENILQTVYIGEIKDLEAYSIFTQR